LRNLDTDDILKSEYDLIEKGLLAFRLLKPGQIHLIAIITIPPNPLSMTSMKHTSQIMRPTGKYDLIMNDVNKLKNIIQQLNQLDLNKYPSIRIACDRFNRSYADKYSEDKLIDLCIGFEALYCKGEKFSPMGSTIGLACSMLLGVDDKHRHEIYYVLEKCFSLRNDIVHGKTYDNALAADLAPSLEKLLRMSILRLIP